MLGSMASIFDTDAWRGWEVAFSERAHSALAKCVYTACHCRPLDSFYSPLYDESHTMTLFIHRKFDSQD